MRLFYLFGLTLLLTLAACGPRTGDFQNTLYVFGTLVDITLHDTTQQQSDAAINDLEKTFQRMHRDPGFRPTAEMEDGTS